MTEAQARALLRQYGPNEIPRERRSAVADFLRRFLGPVPLVLEATLLLTLFSRRFGDAAAIAFLLCFNAAVSAVQEGRARNALDLLRARVIVRARVRRDGSWTLRPARELVPGDTVHLGSGHVVPADVRLESGSIDVDQSALTGESAPRPVAIANIAYAGTTVTRGDAVATVTSTGTRTAYGKTAELVRIAGSRGELERVVLRIVSVLSVVSIAAVAAITAFGLSVGFGAVDVVLFAVMILLASVPIALPAAFTLATTFGSLDLARRGALITRLSALEDAASMDVLCTDKTGTLTENRITVQQIAAFEPFTEADVAALAAAASDEAAQDPLDLAVLRYAQSIRAVPPVRSAFVPFQAATKYSSASVTWKGADAAAYKGAPPELKRLMPAPPDSFDGSVERLASTGARVIAVAAGSGDRVQAAGLIALADPARRDAGALVARLKELGVETVLLTGDTLPTAQHVAREIGIPRAAVHASVFPADKLETIRRFQRDGHVVGMTGDGINDAPALRQANIGIAVSNATDIAKAAAGIVLTEPGLGNVVAAIESSRAIFERMMTYTMMKLVKYFEVVGVLVAAFFATKQFLLTPELMVAMLIFNDFVTLSITTDAVHPSQVRDAWRIGRLVETSIPVAAYTAACVLGIVAYAHAALHVQSAQLRSVAFVAIVLMGQIVLYAVRDRRNVFGAKPPIWLAGSSLLSVAGVLAMAAFGILMPRMPLETIARVLAMTLLAGGVLAAAKAALLAFAPWRGTRT